MKTKLKTGKRKTSVTRQRVRSVIKSNYIIAMDIYQHDLMLSIGESDEVLFKKLINAGVDESEVEQAKYASGGLGRYCLFKSGQSLIRIKAKPKIPQEFGTLAHEIFHIATALLWRIGMKLKLKSSDEAYAYLIGYLTTEIYKKL